MAISSVSNGTPIYKPTGAKPAQGQQPQPPVPAPAIQVPAPAPTTNPEGQPVGQVINTSA